MPIPLRVLSIDGGGMRGVYTAAYLAGLIEAFSQERKAKALDLGKGFDLIIGTSTGAIIGCAAAIGLSMPKVVKMYCENAAKIFPARLYGFVSLAGRIEQVSGAQQMLILRWRLRADLVTSLFSILATPALDLNAFRAPFPFESAQNAATNRA